MKTLRDVVTRLKRERLDLGKDYLQLLEITVAHFVAANGQVPLSGLSADHVRQMMRSLMDRGRSIETVNGYRRRLLLLWQEAREFGFEAPPVPSRRDVRRLKTIARIPQAWHPDELRALLAACEEVPPSKGWGAQHDRALLLTVYDTSLRVGALLKSEISQLDLRRHTLYVPGDKQKGKADTLQPLHPDTVLAVAALPRPAGDKRLFPLPICRRNLFIRLGRVLSAAGLPSTRRDKFHKVRRTSYSLVASRYGIAAASQHAAHKSDLSRYYLDPTFLDQPNPLDALPRPESRAG